MVNVNSHQCEATIRFKSLVNDFVYSFGRAALLLLVEVQNRIVPVRERRRIRVKQMTELSPQLTCAANWKILPHCERLPLSSMKIGCVVFCSCGMKTDVLNVRKNTLKMSAWQKR